MRVIAGDLRGRTLHTPPGRAMRPTQGHVRQVLFDILGGEVEGTRVLDLFAGVGSLGIEALSRGAAEAVFVEREAGALRLLRQNIGELGLAGCSRVLPVAVPRAIRILEEEGTRFGWILADPPYGSDLYPWMERTIRSGPGGLLERRGGLVLERSRREAGPAAVGRLRLARTRIVGETSLGFYHWEEGEDDSA